MMKVFDKQWLEHLRLKYRSKSKYITPFIARLAVDPLLAYERKKIENWVRMLPKIAQADVVARLRSESSHQHFGAYFELVMFDFFKSLGCSVELHSQLREGKPDLLITRDDLESPLILEVATVFDEPYREEEERKLYLILDQISHIKHRFLVNISVESEHIPENVDYERLNQFLIKWLDNLDLKGQHKVQTIAYEMSGLRLSLTAILKLQRKYSIIGGYGLPVRFIGAKQLRRVLQRKITKYKSVKSLGVPFIIALSLADSPLDEKNIINELFGKLQLSIFRNGEGKVVGEKVHRSSNGLVTPKPWLDGRPQNTRLSGIIVIKSRWWEPEGEKGQAKRVHHISMIHNPFASVPLNQGFLKGYPQLVPSVEGDESVTLSWIDK